MQKLLASVVGLAAATALATAGGEKSGKLEGKWKAVGAIDNKGQKVPQEEIEKAMISIVFKDGKYTVSFLGKEADSGTYKTDTTKKPATIDLSGSKGKTDEGIYKVEGDTMTLAMAHSTKQKKADRPKAFDGKDNSDVTIFKRVK